MRAVRNTTAFFGISNKSPLRKIKMERSSEIVCKKVHNILTAWLRFVEKRSKTFFSDFLRACGAYLVKRLVLVSQTVQKIAFWGLDDPAWIANYSETKSMHSETSSNFVILMNDKLEWRQKDSCNQPSTRAVQLKVCSKRIIQVLFGSQPQS